MIDSINVITLHNASVYVLNNSKPITTLNATLIIERLDEANITTSE